jgi:threonine dehydrogenase-like Zn-dependent dehydrogenase
MRALVYQGLERIALEDVPRPQIEDDEDAIVRCTATSISGTDIHLINGKTPGMKPGQILGHEMVGVIEEVGERVGRFRPGERVVVPSTIACGRCSMCRQGEFAHCLTVLGGRTAFFGGSEGSGSFPGLQAEYARVPFADVGLLKIPDDVDDEAALTLSDIFPTGYFSVDIAQVSEGEAVAVFGCGAVGLYAQLSCATRGASPIFAIDRWPARLELARRFPNVRTIDYSREDPTEVILSETDGGVDVAIDCVGMEASDPQGRPNPGQVQSYALRCVRPTGVVSTVGLYGELEGYPLELIVSKNLSLVAGNCNHRAYVADLLDYLRSHPKDGRFVWSHHLHLGDLPRAYEMFLSKEVGMVKPFITP